ncbi:MAG: M28 family peptidase [Candidatus Eremiobacteraeota bacterium]|nr:M28 family peptidase [Candidatus Eremiobacteraeota bacterium]
MGRRKATLPLWKSYYPYAAIPLLCGAALLLLSFFWQGRPAFDEKRAYGHMTRILEYGPRPPGSQALEKVRAYLVASLSQDGLPVTEDTFQAKTPLGKVVMKNITAIVPGDPERVVIVGAHYESKYFPQFAFVGANDNASGTAALLELARILPGKKHRFTTKLVFFDGEEALVQWSPSDGLYGSRRFVEESVKDGSLGRIKAMLLLDMIGDGNLAVNRDLNSTTALSKLMETTAAELGYSDYFSGSDICLDDDHIPFLRKGIPSLDIIDFTYPEWHTAGDVLERTSEKSLGIVGAVIERMLERMNNI